MSVYEIPPGSKTVSVHHTERAVKHSDWVASTEHFQLCNAMSYVCMQIAALIERVADEVHLLLKDRLTLQQRESLLMDLLTGHAF